jgi:hypothetical protein
MGDPGDRLRLGREARQELLLRSIIEPPGCLQDLHCDGAIEGRLDGAIHDTEASFGYRTLDDEASVKRLSGQLEHIDALPTAQRLVGRLSHGLKKLPQIPISVGFGVLVEILGSL